MPQTFNSTVQYYVAAASQPDAYMAGASGGTTTGTNLILTNRTSALQFTVVRSPHDASKWNICSAYSVGANYCVNQWGNNVTQGALITAGYWTGSELTLVGSDQSDGSTVWTIQSDFAGTDKYLSASGNNVIMIANAPAGTSNWKMIDSSKITTANATTTTTTTSTSAGATSSIIDANYYSSNSKSPMAIIIGLVVAFLVIIVGAIVAYCCIRKRRKAKKAKASQAMPPLMQEQPVPRPDSHPISYYAPVDKPKRKPVPPPVEVPGSTPGVHNLHGAPSQPTDRLLSEMDGSQQDHEVRPVYELDGGRHT